MTQENDFLTKFEDSLRTLDELTALVGNSVKEREDFSNNLKNKLSQINNRLKSFNDEINNLKDLVNSLNARVKTNEGLIDQLRKETNNRLTETIDSNKNISQVVDMKSKEITELNSKIQQLQNEVNNKNNEIEQLKIKGTNDNKDLIAQKQLEIQELHKNITYLKEQGNEYYDKLENNNALLRAKIEAATQIINNATIAMKKLLDSAPNATTKQEVNSILASIESNIKSMEDINNELEKSFNNENFNTIKKGSDDFAFGGRRMTRKRRRRRKNKKQKGGFTYKINYKRKSIISHTNTLRKGSKSTSNRSRR